jgi:ribose 5-phosphate isomerase B
MSGWDTVWMRVHLGTDHAGLELKQHLITWLEGRGHQAVDHGAFVYDAEDDYPVFCTRAAAAVAADHGSLGVVIGGSGNGEQIAANKVKGVRAALVWNDDTAVLARQHNDANVISVGGRMHTVEEMTAFVGLFLDTPFSGEERHVRRIAMITDYEVTGDLPPLPDSAQGPGPDA